MPDLKQSSPVPASTKEQGPSSRFVLELAGILELSDEEMLRLSAKNDHLQLEQDAHGNLIVMPPAGGTTSRRNSDLVADLSIWNRQTGLGVVFGPDGGFKLPNGARRAPDAAWVSNERWEALSDEEREEFPPLCPDFVCELRFSSDHIASLQEKMEEYIANGCRLGWLIDPYEEHAFVYRPNESMATVNFFDEILSGGDVLPGFELSLAALR